MDENLKVILLATIPGFLGIVGVVAADFFRKWLNKRRENKEENKLDSEAKNLNSSARRADAETSTERAVADKTYIEAMTLTMDAQKKLFDDRMLLLEQRTLENSQLAEKRQLEITATLTAIKLENTQMKAENQKIKNENYDLHQENIQLVSVISKLQVALKGLKKLIEKLLGGINKLISYMETNHKDEVIPWKPVLTDEEQLLFQSDFDFKDLKTYNEK